MRKQKTCGTNIKKSIFTKGVVHLSGRTFFTIFGDYELDEGG